VRQEVDVLRLRFTTGDLARVRIAAQANPFAETALAAEQMRRRTIPHTLQGWRSGMRGRLHHRARMLSYLFGGQGPGLDLSTLAGPAASMAEGLDGLQRARPAAFAAELKYVALQHPLTPWAKSLADADQAARHQLADTLAAFHDVAIGPHWAAVEAHLRACRARWRRTLADDGLDQVLATICPTHIRWREPELEVDSLHGIHANVELAGRGLVLVPSVFVGDRPYLSFALGDEGAAPQLVVPVLHDLTVARRVFRPQQHEASLASLLGRTRSAVLQAVADGAGTGEIAKWLGVSAATISEHTAVLRASGLIVTHRDGASVLHVLTELGAALLNGTETS
jgi:DNA-binding transcriptional ArsR family regulator